MICYLGGTGMIKVLFGGHKGGQGVILGGKGVINVLFRGHI